MAVEGCPLQESKFVGMLISRWRTYRSYRFGKQRENALSRIHLSSHPPIRSATHLPMSPSLLETHFFPVPEYQNQPIIITAFFLNSITDLHLHSLLLQSPCHSLLLRCLYFKHFTRKPSEWMSGPGVSLLILPLHHLKVTLIPPIHNTLTSSNILTRPSTIYIFNICPSPVGDQSPDQEPLLLHSVINISHRPDSDPTLPCRGPFVRVDNHIPQNRTLLPPTVPFQTPALDLLILR